MDDTQNVRTGDVVTNDEHALSADEYDMAIEAAMEMLVALALDVAAAVPGSHYHERQNKRLQQCNALITRLRAQAACV